MKNVVILILDTVGYNYTSLGGGPAKMPNLREWADNNLHLSNYVSPATYTCQSLSSILTGLNALHHCTGMPVRPTWNLPVSIRTIFDVFGEHGHECAVIGDIPHLLCHSRAIIPNGKPRMSPGKYNHNQDFAMCEILPPSEDKKNVEFIANGLINSVSQLTEPYIVMMHTLAPHGPCGEPIRMNELDRKYKEAHPKSEERIKYATMLRDLYCRRLEDVDHQIIAPIINRFSNDFLIIMSDHGVEINSGATGVGHMAWNTIDSLFCMSYHTPIVYNYPFSGVDILPTICELFGIPVHHRIDGESMVGKIDSNISNDRFYHIWSSNCQAIQRLFTRITFRDPRLPDRWLPASDRNIEYDDVMVGHWGFLEKHIDIIKPAIDVSNPSNRYVNIHDECVNGFIKWYEEQLDMPLYDGVPHVFTRYEEDVPDNRNAKHAPSTV